LPIVRQVHLYCFHCKFSKTYLPEENPAGRCPNCGIEANPKHKRRKVIVRSIPALIWLGVLYCFFWFTKALKNITSLFWLALGSFFPLIWIQAVLVSSKHVQPQFRFILKWPGQDIPPQRVNGEKVKLTFGKGIETTATIQDYRSVQAPATRKMWVTTGQRFGKRLYILRPDGAIQGVLKPGQDVLFHPESARFKKGIKKLLKGRYGDFSYTVSVEDLLLNPACQCYSIGGRVFGLRNPQNSSKRNMKWSDLRFSGRTCMLSRINMLVL
jgi:hypothetical protein